MKMDQKKSILAGITAAVVVLSSGIMAFAATDSADQADAGELKRMPSYMESLTEEQRDAVHQARLDSLTEAVAQLVEDGTITQELADRITEEKGMLKDLDLTDEQKTAINEARSAAMQEAVENLVDEGILTQEEADSLTAMFEKAKTREDRPKENRPAGLLTEEQRTALQEAMKTILESRLDDLVDDGTISRDLADQILTDSGALRIGPGGRPGAGGPPALEGKPETESEETETI